MIEQRTATLVWLGQLAILKLLPKVDLLLRLSKEKERETR